MSRSILFLSYLFPPRGGAGVQRALKFVKYLPEFGWKPLVVANGGTARDHVITRQDPSLLRDLAPDAVVRYTQLTAAEQRNYDRLQANWRARLTVTDRMGWWVEPAVRTGMELLAEHDASAIFVTMSPFTSAEAGIELKKRTGLPLIFDLRDPWALDETHIYPTPWHASEDLRRMRRAFAAADLVIMNTPDSLEAARRACPIAPGARMVALTNGFDADDMESGEQKLVSAAPREVLRIVHTGQFHSDLAEVWDRLYEGRGLLDRLKRPRRQINNWARTPRYLLQAMERLVSSGQVSAGAMELVLVGNITDADQREVDRSPVRSMVKILGYRNHDESVQWVQSADVLFLPLHIPLDGGPALIVPGKTYEYLGSGRPILAMGGPGDMRRLVEAAKAGVAIQGDDVTAAADALLKFYRGKLDGIQLFETDRAYVRNLERRELTRRLAEELNQTVSAKVSASSGLPDGSIVHGAVAGAASAAD